ncbi:hypothetical protein Scep_029537 [Stephania cephalantha]|uniref:TOG domain-containing protein n=1 Tax=Stephania cephalantha TaxID=152367 RepID=A0AAP0DXX0_9MAGN
MAELMEVLRSVAESVSTSSTKQRVRFFRDGILPHLNGGGGYMVSSAIEEPKELTVDHASVLVDIIFRTLSIYDDRASRKAVDDVIVKAFGEVTFMKNFAATLVQATEKQLKSKSHCGCYKLLKWSCLLLSSSSEGRLSFPYQRVGMMNALQELSNNPDGKLMNSLAPSICSYLLSCYKDDGNEEVKLAILVALASWAARSAEAVQSDVVSFIAIGLKEKEVLRRAHLRCLRIICKNPDVCVQISSLLGPLVQLVKSGFTKATQKLDGIYALLVTSKIASVDVKAAIPVYTDDILVKEKIWGLIIQSEPSLILYLCCHTTWEVRKIACDAIQKILSATPQLTNNLLLEFSSYLSVVAERMDSLKAGDADNSLDSQLPAVPSVEVLVKALLAMSLPSIAVGSNAFVRIMLCAHHPCLVSMGNKDSVWQRLRKSLQRHGHDVFGIVAADLGKICKFLLEDVPPKLNHLRQCRARVTIMHDLLGPMGLMSQNPLEQHAAINCLSTLMSVLPKDIYDEFQKFLNTHPDRFLHDELSERDIQVFHTPEGILSSELGVYVAEAVPVKNAKQAKGRFRAYDDLDDQDYVKHNHSVQKEPVKREANALGKRDLGKGTKKTDKGKNAKEEARDLLLKEEALTREKVQSIQNNLSLMLRAIGELTVSSPIFFHSELPSLVKVVNPLLRSPIVSDVAFETMLSLSKCLAYPLCNWAPDIAAALRIISTEKHVILDLFSSVGEELSSEGPYLGLFERIVKGLSMSCQYGPLPVDSFVFIFPILEQILLSTKKTGLHDDVLKILALHLDPILPLPRIRMLSVLYHVLGVVPAFQALIAPMLNELCLGLQADELAPALCGVYSKGVHVRLACLNAVKCIPSVSGRSLPQNVEVATCIWIALHDPEKTVSVVAEDVWDRYGYEFGTDYSGLLVALSHNNYNVRLAAAEAIAAAMDEDPDTIQETLSKLFSLYIQSAASGEDNVDSSWLGRQGISLALKCAADVLRTKDLPVVMTFLISRALADPNADVRGRMINAGILIIDKHGKENASDEEKYDLVREGVVIFTGALARHLSKDDSKVHAVVEKLLDVLNTPSEAVQRAVSTCLSPLMLSKKDEAQALVSRLLNQLMHSDKYGERRGAAFGLAGVVKGFGISCLKKNGIVVALQQGLEDSAAVTEVVDLCDEAAVVLNDLCDESMRSSRILPFITKHFYALNSAKAREGALLAFECLCENLGRVFEPYVDELQSCYCCFSCLKNAYSSDPLYFRSVVAVREAAECAARAMMSQLSGPGVKLVLPSLLKGLEDKAWRTKQSSVQLLGAMAYCAPQQLSQCLPLIVPKLTEVLTDTHPKVQSAGQMALQQVGSVIKNPEISSLVPTLLKALADPNDFTKHSLDILLQTTFVNSVDAPSLALLVPIVHRGLRERSAETKKKAAQIVGNMCSLVTEPKDMIPYIALLLPEVKKVLVDPIPEVRSVAARALGSLIRGMGEENFPDLVPWLLDTLKSDNSNVERSGAAQGLSEIANLTFLPRLYLQVLAALGKDYFEHTLPEIIRNCSHQRASIRDGYLTVFKVAGTSGKAILEGGSDDEGASTEAHGRAIIEVLGRDKRNEVLAAVYMVRTDVSISVRQASCLTCLEDCSCKHSKDSEGNNASFDEYVDNFSGIILSRKTAARAIHSMDGQIEVAKKVEDSPLSTVHTAGYWYTRCRSSILGVFARSMVGSFSPEVAEMVSVREDFNLRLSAGMQAIDEIVPTLLHALEDDETSDTALDGLKQILSAFNVHALGALAEVAGPSLNFHLGTILPALVEAMDDKDTDVQKLAKKAAETVVLEIDEDGIDSLIAELLKGVNDSKAFVRRGSSYLIGHLFKNSKLYLVDEVPNIISTLIVLLSDSDPATIEAAWEALSRVIGSVPKEVLPTYIKTVRDSLSTSRDKERRKRKGVPVLIPGLCLPKALQPLLPVFLQAEPKASCAAELRVLYLSAGLISGSAELREQAAQGLGELIEVTSEKALKEFVVPITGFNETLTLISMTVRSSSAVALGKLSALSARVDPLVGDLLSTLQLSDGGVQEAALTALNGVVKHAGKSVSNATRSRVTLALKDLIYVDVDEIRISASRVLGTMSQHMEDSELFDLLQYLIQSMSSASWCIRHGSVLTISSILGRNAAMGCSSSMLPLIINNLKESLKDDKFPVRETASKAVGRLLLHQIKNDGINSNVQGELVAVLISALQDDSSEVRRRTLSGLKAASKANPLAIMTYSLTLGPALAECLKDGNTPVRLAAERCILHVFQLAKGM